MFNDDAPVGRLLSRREAVGILGATGAALLTGSAHGVQRAEARLHGLSCVARPDQMEGPYFVDEKLNRSDLRVGTAGGRCTCTSTSAPRTASPTACRLRRRRR